MSSRKPSPRRATKHTDASLKQALLAREEWLGLAAQGSSLGLWYWNEVTEILFADQKTREIFGVSQDGEVTVETFYNAMHPDDLERVREVWRYALESGLPYELEYRALRPDGSVRWVNARGKGYYNGAGKPLYMIGVVFDITERKEIEQERLVLGEQLAHAGRLTVLGTLAASIAHELTQPLTAVRANARAALQLLDRPVPDVAEATLALQDIVRDEHRAAEMVLHFRRLLTRSASAKPPCDLKATIHGVVNLVCCEAVKRHIALNCDVAGEMPPVPGDRVQLQQVILNLLINAFDAVTEPASIARAVTVRASDDHAGGVVVAVEDEGPAVSDERFGRMRTPLYTTKPEGLGLGLAICREILAAHGSELRMARKDPGGMVFSFTLSQAVPADPGALGLS
jgi:PAS domain S-box-containing protein